MLNRLSSVLANAGFYKQEQRWTRRKLQSVSEVRSSRESLSLRPVYFRFSILTLQSHFSKHRFILETVSNRKCADCVITPLLVSH